MSQAMPLCHTSHYETVARGLEVKSRVYLSVVKLFGIFAFNGQCWRRLTLSPKAKKAKLAKEENIQHLVSQVRFFICGATCFPSCFGLSSMAGPI